MLVARRGVLGLEVLATTPQEIGPGLWTATRTPQGEGGSRSSLVELGRNGRAGCGVPSKDGMTCRSAA
jgi:hypothetical protein